MVKVTHEIHFALIQDTIDKVVKVNIALKALDGAVKKFSSAAPHESGIERINNASDELFIAHKELLKAHSNQKEFESRGPSALSRCADADAGGNGHFHTTFGIVPEDPTL